MRAVLTFVARLCLCAVFIAAVVTDLVPNFSSVAEAMSAEGVRWAPLLLAGAIGLLLVGSVSVALGYQARFGAACLIAFLIPTTYYFHDFWNAWSRASGLADLTQFLKNLGLAGAFLAILVNGAGPGSVDGLDDGPPS